MSDRQPIVISPQEYKSAQIAESKRIAAENRLDECPEGGRYLVGDQYVDANGNILKDAVEDKREDKAFASERPVRGERKSE